VLFSNAECYFLELRTPDWHLCFQFVQHVHKPEIETEELSVNFVKLSFQLQQ